MSTAIVGIVSELRSIVATWRREGLRIAVVPTMGALHERHLSLVRAALGKVDRVIVTLFVDPKQFNNADDLAAYPRTEHDDAAKLASVGAHILYAPDAADIYPQGFATTVSVSGASEGFAARSAPATSMAWRRWSQASSAEWCRSGVFRREGLSATPYPAPACP